MIRSTLRNILQGFGIKPKNPSVKLGMNANKSFHKSSTIESKDSGRLLFGATWNSADTFPSLLVLNEGSKLILNNQFKVYSGSKIYVNKNACLSLGSGYANHNFNISCFNSITIGEGVAISENVTLRDSDNHTILESQYGVSAPIVIGNHVWVGLNVTILKGVTIGEGAVIAAGSVVNRNVPANTLVGGVPARVIRENIHWK